MSQKEILDGGGNLAQRAGQSMQFGASGLRRRRQPGNVARDIAKAAGNLRRRLGQLIGQHRSRAADRAGNAR